MKKISLLFAMLLVLVSSIVFCSCGDGYKDLKIECDTKEIVLVLDDEELSTENVVFELSGVKSWGEISIVSKPLGLVQIIHEIDGSKCGVAVKALQPSGEGASLCITHLGSGKSLSVPLRIGRKLQSVESNGKNFVVKLPEVIEDENTQETITTQIQIPSKELLNCYPRNYTDDIVWQSVTSDLPTGVSLISYDEDGEVVQAFNDMEAYGEKRKGSSSAVKTVLAIDSRSASECSLRISPISVLDGEAIYHKDIVIEVDIANLLTSKHVQPFSNTHGDINGQLKDLVLISNPDEDRPRDDSVAYDYYSATEIDIKAIVGEQFENLDKYNKFYQMELSTDIEGLRLESVDFGKIRAIATSTCIGVGQIVAKFVPNDCVGDVKEFSISIPCEVGERPTSFVVKNNGNTISTTQVDEYTFESIVPLNDSTSLGQAFRFQLLSTNTLSALSNFKITINKNLLYINPNEIDEITQTSKYIRNSDDSGNVNLSTILNNKYDYQISILKDGRQITFYEDGENFVSEALNDTNTIYIKWVKTDGVNSVADTYFGISVASVYDERYDIENHGFDKTSITYNLAFNRQRTVESISYVPVKVVRENESWNIVNADDAGDDWQFYFEPSMFDDNTILYGIRVLEVLGINSTALTDDELSNINLEFSVSSKSLGFALYEGQNTGLNYESSYIFNFDSDGLNFNKNIVLLGKTDDLNYGDYEIEIIQNSRNISSRNLRIYKNLEENDVNVNIPSADFEGMYLMYKKLDTKPSDWTQNYNTYYEYLAGQYVNVSNYTWDTNKAYYQKVEVLAQIDGQSKSIEINNTYILATSKSYVVDIKVANKDFVDISNQSVSAKVIGNSNDLLGDEYIKNLCTKDNLGNNILKTGIKGLFNTTTRENNYIQLTYQISSQSYDYYKLKEDDDITVEKVIYIYIYEPLTFAKFDNTMLYKYDINSIQNNQFKENYGKQTLNIELNNESVLDYVDIQWKTRGDGISAFELIDKNSATYSFVAPNGETTTSNIVATLTQFGIQYPIYCGFSVSKPIISEKVVLNNATYNLQSGNSFINLKMGQSIDIDADAISSNGEVSLKGFEYIVCSTTGYHINTIATINNGKLTAVNSGRAKLIVVAKDVLTDSLTNVVNYFATSSYIYNNAYVMVDIMVSDGSEEYPYLIATSRDFKAIANDYYYIGVDGSGNPIKINANGDTSKINDYHYALVSDIDLNGVGITFDNFEGVISSFAEDENSNNRFAIYGVMLTENNPTLFNQIVLRDDELANLKNIDFHVDINYTSTRNRTSDILIGLVGINSGFLNNITVSVSGQIDAGNIINTYTIGSISAKNTEMIVIDDSVLVGVEGQVVVKNSVLANIVLGGVIGENEGILIGANKDITIATNENADEVYYGNQGVRYNNQGAIADVVLQVKGVNSFDNSTIGGVVGYNNNGTILNVYAMGKVLGVDDSNALVVDNVGGLIGRNNNNTNINATVTTKNLNDAVVIDKVEFASNAQYQVVNSYSSAQVWGRNNVGGAVGYDNRGSYKKVYYEIYTVQESVKGNNNVGGLIGNAQDSNLYYCYANSFAWNYSNSVDTYDVIGRINVGGLIGLAQSSRDESFTKQTYNYSAMNIVSSLASVSISGLNDVSGLVGRLNNFGAIYTAYYYGVINPQIIFSPITTMYRKDTSTSNITYNNVYAIVNSVESIDGSLYTGAGFNINTQYNNGKPYIEYEYNYLDGEGEKTYLTNLVSVIPTIIQLNEAFETYYDNNAMYKLNNLGDYVKVDGKMEVYDKDKHDAGMSRYSLMAEVVETGDLNGNPSDYRTKALVLYYYQFSDMSGENALTDLYNINTINVHDIINDKGIIVLPNTFKRFNLRSSNNNIVSILTGGRLLLRNEGQVTITLTSTRNPSVTASFVVIVRTKVLEFNLYSSANLREEYNIEDATLNIVKGSSKLIYVDYSSTIREYDYKSATNMEIDFKITYNGTDEKILNGTNKINEYISLNGVYDENSGIYTISYGMPITITVDEYVDGEFVIMAKPYVVVNYVNGQYSQKLRVDLSGYFETSFKIATKKGATAINTDKTQIDMMPADEATNINVKISTDIKVDELYFEMEAVGNIFEFADINNGSIIKCIEMLDIAHNSTKIDLIYDDEVAKGTIDVSQISLHDALQALNLSLKLNEKSYYMDEEFRLQIKFIVKNGQQEIYSIVHVDVKTQEISSLVALNYRMEDGREDLSLDNAYLSQVIRPGSTNIITIDLAPSIAIYDHVEIRDITVEDKILFQQVNSDLSPLNHMDTWIDSGIKLSKYDAKTSKLYVIAKLPLYATANITHTIQITVYDKDNNQLRVSYLNLEAVMYPTVVMTYNYPNGKSVVADTREGNAQQIISVNADLAMGVEAYIDVKAYNIDEGSLHGNLTIKNGSDVIENNNYVQLSSGYDDNYILRFNINKKADWEMLIGKNIEVTFTAYKKLNGITESCSATISFSIRRMVVHSVSMTHTTSNDELYGDWDEELTTQFYFDKTDISYYNNGYWNVQYTLDNLNTESIVDAQLKEDLETIKGLLEEFNTFNTNKEEDEPINIYLVDKYNNSQRLTSNYNSEGISIANKNNTFVIKAQETSSINGMKLVVKYKLSYNAQNAPTFDINGTELSNQFGFNITKKTTPFDEYLTISSQEEFEDMLEGKYYQLTKDIILKNYSPINTAIGALNGAGYTIIVESFNESQLIQDYISSGMYIGLFGTLAQDSVIQNLKVDYSNIIINLDGSETIREQHTNNIYFGGIAGINLGVITNVNVNGSFKLQSQYINAEQIALGGIVADNGASNSQKIATITGSTSQINLSAMALVGGVSVTNYGKIANTNFKGSITSNEANEYVANILTAGFVVTNSNGAYISLSYVDCGLGESGYNIHSVGRTAGFVFNNSGTINNSYINQTSIRSQGNIGGFVYQSSGDITNCYSYPTLGNSLFYQEFIYSTENVGTITNCRVITDSTKNLNVSGLKAIKIIDVAIEEKYDGFIFAKRSNGVWSLQDNGPYLATAGFNSNTTDYANIYNIYDLETFEGYFNTDSDIIEGKTYRIVRDIDFESGNLNRNPITFNKTLKASIEGNDMALLNYNIYKVGDVESIGLFARIETSGLGIYVRNLILQPTSIKATGSVAVGALAGEVDSVDIYNIKIDNQDLLILGKNAVGGLAGIIKGDFEIIGIESNVSAFATYSYNVAEQYNLYTGKNVTNSTLLNNISEVSYAGSVAGIINGYNMSRTSMEDRNIDAYYSIRNITINGNLVIIGETVGGAFGLVGERTMVTNINYNMQSETLYQGIYVSGGLVGENRGIIKDSKIFAYDENKDKIDTTNCFNKYAQVNGGIVGLNIGGLVDNCSSDVDIYTSKSLATVGGIVGRNIEGSVYNCSIYGSIDAYFVGGIAGTDYSYSTIIQQEIGYGTATITSKRVYSNIQNKVKYDESCVANYDVEKLYKGNIITHKFLTEFIAKKSNYYTFNEAYVNNMVNNLSITKSVFGLVIGLTDNSYIASIVDENGNNDITYNNDKLIVDLTNGQQADNRPEYTLAYNNTPYTVKPISNIIAPNLDLLVNLPTNSDEVLFLYLIAYDNALYEFWSSTLGYTQQYIAITKNALN